ncbi:MAG: hypothetical protein ACKVRN_15025 [Pyrinomonadaceae bacterium]
MRDSWQIVRQRAEKRRKLARIYVSLNRRGEIAFNAEAFARIGRPASVTLLYEPASKRLGVKYPVALDRHFFPVRRYGRGKRTLIVRAARLLKQFGIEVERTLVFKNIAVENLGGNPMLIMNMEEIKHDREMDGVSGEAD